ncbi:MAG: c-type cytochrome [Acidiferrobacterales bacterium]
MERKMPAGRSRTYRFFAMATLALWPWVAIAGPEHLGSGGARLYVRYCATCHGEKGRGGIGLPLALPSFQSGVDDAYLRRTIRLGRPGRIMSALPQLRNDQVDALVRYIRRWSGSRPVTLTATGKPGNAMRGASLFAAHCAICHGAKGVGGYGTGVTLSRPRSQSIMAPALDNPGFLASASDRVIRTAIVRGRAGTPMPSSAKQGLSRHDVDDLVAYVRSLRGQPFPAAAALRDEGPDIVGVSPDGVSATVARLKEAVQAANMRLIRIQYLDQGFVPAGHENKEQVIVYSCDFGFLNTALQVDPRVGLFLPCRVTVLRHHGKVLVMSVNPKRLGTLFNNAALNSLCDRMYRKYRNVIEEATF